MDRFSSHPAAAGLADAVARLLELVAGDAARKAVQAALAERSAAPTHRVTASQAEPGGATCLNTPTAMKRTGASRARLWALYRDGKLPGQLRTVRGGWKGLYFHVADLDAVFGAPGGAADEAPRTVTAASAAEAPADADHAAAIP